jgi:hypothetical protein
LSCPVSKAVAKLVASPLPAREVNSGSTSVDEKTYAAGSDRPIEDGFCPVCDGRRPEAGYERSTGGAHHAARKGRFLGLVTLVSVLVPKLALSMRKD